MQTKSFGYVRVSSKDQNIDRQIKELLAAGINERDIFSDKQSGKDFERPMYQALRRQLREGDKLYIKSLDRFGRNKENILNEWQYITKVIKAHIIVIDMPLLDTTRYTSVSGLENLISDLVLQLLSYFAEDERQRIRARQREGINIAKNKGQHFGRRGMEYPQYWEFYYNNWKQGKATAVDTFKTLNISKSTFYKFVKQYENGGIKHEQTAAYDR